MGLILTLDRMGLSAKNGWRDELGRVYIYYTLAEIQEDFNCGHDRVLRMLAELDTEKGIGLIERKKQGQGKPTMIYVKQFSQAESPSPRDQSDHFRLRESRSQEIEDILHIVDTERLLLTGDQVLHIYLARGHFIRSGY